MNWNVEILGEALNIQSCTDWAKSSESGGINVFIGTVRNETKDKKVTRLLFEVYESMAIKEMQKLAEDVLEKWPVHKILIHHRKGELQPGDIAVIIVVSASHRDAAFTACRYTIDTLKQTVPIWKKEYFDDGAVWVAAHP
jgi:molybdopterin synthase catalytic subunit